MRVLFGTFVVRTQSDTVGILIEDKINAVAQPEQAARYLVRGSTGIANKDYNAFKVLIVAPEEYLNANSEAKKYEKQISYEFLQSLFDENSFEYQLLAEALRKKRAGGETKEVKEITDFNDSLYDYVKQNYPALEFNSVKGAVKGPGCTWFSFRTPVKDVWIVYKSTHQHVDMELRGLGEYQYQILDRNAEVLDCRDMYTMYLRRIGKSLAVRIDIVGTLDCYQAFETQIPVMKKALDAVLFLQQEVLPALDLI